MLRQYIFTLLVAMLPVLASANPVDTIRISDIYTSHIIFSTEINYADLSNQKAIAAKIVEGSKNKLAIKARMPFTTTASLSVEEAGGVFHTYIVKYDREPGALILDRRPGAERYPLDEITTIEISDKYTTHLLFSTDINYADLSRPASVIGKLVEQGKNKLALMAREPFPGRISIAVEESNGVFHTYYLKYAPSPSTLVVDTRSTGTMGVNTGSNIRNSREKEASSVVAGRRGSSTDNSLKRRDAPSLKEVLEIKQNLYHTAVRDYHLLFSCENIFAYSDMTYIVLSLKNNSNISYETEDAVFILETKQKGRRKIPEESTLIAKNKAGNLTVGPHAESRAAYSFDKITLASNQQICVYLYESGGRRELVLTLTAADINGALSPR